MKKFIKWLSIYLTLAIMFTIITFLTVDVGVPGEPSRFGFIWSQGVGCWLSYEIANKITKKFKESNDE